MTSKITPNTGSAGRVTNLELFFDLVFVFTITQVTEILAHSHHGYEFARAFLVLLIVWWMYAGYAWLTNNIAIYQPFNRVLVLLAMGGFLVMSLAIPQVFSHDGLVFGLAYFFVNLIHAALFTRAPNESAKAIWRIAPLNLGTAGLIVAAGCVPEAWNWIFWLAALVALAVVPFWLGGGFALEPKHFVERHGLVLLIALGESVVAIGIGAIGLPVNLSLVSAALLTLALVATLWWAYFDKNERAAEHALAEMAPRVRARRALFSFGYAQLFMISGVVASAAGIKLVLEHFIEPSSVIAAGLLAVGIALYLAGESAFRAVLRLPLRYGRIVAIVLVLGTVPLGTLVNGLAQLAVILLLMVLALVSERPWKTAA